MAGGKETPRQKMIGMMYLVLTALLALNVSKSILDAFVAIEENIQKANIVQAARGTGFRDDVKSELSATKGEDQVAKKKKLEYVLAQMEAIDKEAEDMIKFIDELKLEVMSKAGEKVTDYKNEDAEAILWKKRDGIYPTRMNLMAVQAKDQYDIPMQVLGINESIKDPKGKGLELWNKFNNYRSKIVELTGTYKWGEGNSFIVKADKINDFKDNTELTTKVVAMIDKQEKTANLKEDRQTLIDLYMMLTKSEKNNVNKQDGVHWIGMTFDHSPLVATLASLSGLQQDILSARALALNHWKGKVTTGEYSFNKITALAYGQPIANTGDSVYIQVMMAAYDSDNQPTVKVLSGADGATTKYPGNGQGIVGFKVGGGAEQIVEGEVTIMNKSGMPKTEKWTYPVKIMKPSGAISLPELNVLYKGYPNQVEAVASGFDQTTLTGTVPLTKNATGWVATPSPGPAREATLTVSGKNTVTGRSQTLLTKTFKLKMLPKPDVFWGAVSNGGKGSRQETRIFAKYGDDVALNASFSITKWEVSVQGLMGSPTGSGTQLNDAAMGLIRQAKPGSMVTIICDVMGPDRTSKKVVGAFKV